MIKRCCQTFTVLLTFLLLVSASDDLNAQSRSRKKSSELATHLWYGGSLGLGFQSYAQQSSFLFAIFPMAGYKISEDISVGPRIGLSYQYLKIRGLNGGTPYKFNPLELSGAVFARAKVFNPIFAHVEYEVANEKRAYYNNNGVPEIVKSIENNFYIGAGYNSGGKFASEIYVLYNVLEDSSSLDLPFIFRFGFTYNF